MAETSSNSKNPSLEWTELIGLRVVVVKSSGFQLQAILKDITASKSLILTNMKVENMYGILRPIGGKQIVPPHEISKVYLHSPCKPAAPEDK